jgi:hypothetical protein
MQGKTTAEGEKRKSHSLYEPTESMLASQREFDRRKNEIRPEDDPFWEQRGGKGARHLQRYDTLPEKAPRALKDCIDTITPLPNNSRLLTPTQATIFASYHKDEAPKSKQITALSSNSHLLTPTKASSLAEYHHPPSPREKPLTPRSNSGEVAAASHPYSPPAECRLFELTTNRKCAAYEKKIIDTDPRENGWRSLVTPVDPRSPLPAPREIVHHDNPYKEVKSKLFSPTIASVRQQWQAQAEGGEGDLDLDGVSLNGHGEDQHSVSVSPEKASRSHQKRFSQIHSRLHEPTAAHIASQWCNRPPSPAESTSGHRRQSAPGARADSVPAVQAKTTQAQLLNRRAKYVPPDDGDIAKRPSPATRGTQRSKSVPVLGRIYISPRPPPVTERKFSLRTPRVTQPAAEPAQSPYIALVNDAAPTPVVSRGRDSRPEPSTTVEQSGSEDRERESRLSRLFPEVTRAIETLQEETNPSLQDVSSHRHLSLGGDDRDEELLRRPQGDCEAEETAVEEIGRGGGVESTEGLPVDGKGEPARGADAETTEREDTEEVALVE